MGAEPRARATCVAVALPAPSTAPDADADAETLVVAAETAEEPTSDPLLDAADRHWMGVALEQARLAGERGEVPVGAVVVISEGEEQGDAPGDGAAASAAGSGRARPPSPWPPRVGPPSLALGSAQGNRAEALRDPTAHAEALALRSALAALSAGGASWRAALPRATLYATCEPCPMCAGAALACRVGRVVYGCRQPRVGADGSWLPLLRAPRPPLPPPLPPPPLPQPLPSLTPLPLPTAPRWGGRAAGAGGRAGLGENSKEEREQESEEEGERGRGAPLPARLPPPPPPRPPHPYNPGLQVRSGVRAQEAAELLRAFFRRRRNEPKLQE